MIKTIVSIALLSTLTFMGMDINTGLDFFKPNEAYEIAQDDFEKEVIQSEELVLVDFYANWCSPCMDFMPVLDEVAKKEKDVKFVKVDIDNATDLKFEYNIIGVPTIVIFKDGNEIDRHMGPLKNDKLIEWLEGMS